MSVDKQIYATLSKLIAVFYKCRHLANANKFDHIRRVNTLLGLFVPTLVTPLELLGDNNEKESE